MMGLRSILALECMGWLFLGRSSVVLVWSFTDLEGQQIFTYGISCLDGHGVMSNNKMTPFVNFSTLLMVVHRGRFYR